MLARPEWNEPEKREPMYPRAETDNYKISVCSFMVALFVWVYVIFPVLNTLYQRSIEYNITRFGLELR